MSQRAQNQVEIVLVRQAVRTRDHPLSPRTHCKTAYLPSMFCVLHIRSNRRDPPITDGYRLLQQVIPTEEDEIDASGDKASASPQKPAFSLPVMANNFRRFNAR